jgi:DNA topoisomerase-1
MFAMQLPGAASARNPALEDCMPHLVIVESPAKARTINKFLGKDYVVKASVGHIRDLPEKRLAVDIENGFTPEYEISSGKTKVVKELQDEAKRCDTVFLAPDPDREGEAIAWHLQEVLKKQVKDPARFRRVTYNQITKEAIRKAFNEPRQIDQAKVDAQQARRVLDRLVGYQVSPLVWRTIRGGSSAGRVQTVALRLLVEREKEIRAFVPEAYWLIGAQAAKRVAPKDPFAVHLLKLNGEKPEIKSRELADRVVADLKGRSLRVAALQRKQTQRRPPPPFITSTLQQAASSQLGLPPKRTMGLAQKLYEGRDLGQGPVGLITYMRTDSVALAPEAIGAIRTLIGEAYGPDFLPEQANLYKSRESAQGAHEAIRPTDIRLTPDEVKHALDPAELKLYALIWKRTVASQMTPARINQLQVDFDAPKDDVSPGSFDFLFRANASEIAFPGYMKVLGLDEKKDDETELPPLSEGERLDVLDWLCEEKQTQPPNRFSEAALIKALEENGVGRPSTYASIITTLYDRKYAENEKRSIRPTELGIKVCDYLVGHLNNLFDVGFTAQMEEKLDQIERGEVDWSGMLREFHHSLEGWIAGAKGPPASAETITPLLDLLGAVREWAPPSGQGRRKYSDEKFVQEVRAALESGQKPVSQRQLENLRKIVCRYRPQIPGLTDEKARELGLDALLASEAERNLPPDPVSIEKLQALGGVTTWAEPRTFGKRTYDDQAFVASLREQVEGGRRLSEAQAGVLDRILLKYTGQIPDFAERALAWGMAAQLEQAEDHESGPLLTLLRQVTTFDPPVKRGKREWSDAEFFQSLANQFDRKKSLSPKQRAALKKMAARYAAQIPDYAERQPELGLPPPRKARGAAKDRAGEGVEEVGA